jgi:hypothetical protein
MEELRVVRKEVLSEDRQMKMNRETERQADKRANLLFMKQ